MQTVPYLIDNPEVGYVQTRWIFANPDESYLTKAQEISLNFHCKCEQFVHFASGSFFNFNGTAGEATLLLQATAHGSPLLPFQPSNLKECACLASSWLCRVYAGSTSSARLTARQCACSRGGHCSCRGVAA